MSTAKSACSLYRRLWRAGDAAVAGTVRTTRVTSNKLRVRRKIRQAFEEHRAENDRDIITSLIERGTNTVAFLETASRRRGIEHDIVRNLCSMDIFLSKYSVQPPFWNRKIKPHQRELYDTAYDDYAFTLHMLNESLKLSLR